METRLPASCTPGQKAASHLSAGGGGHWWGWPVCWPRGRALLKHSGLCITSASKGHINYSFQCPIYMWCKQLTHWKSPWCWERLKAESSRRWRQRMRWLDSITNAMDVNLANFGRWWRTERPGVLQSMGSQSRTQLGGLNINNLNNISWTSVHQSPVQISSSLFLQLHTHTYRHTHTHAYIHTSYIYHSLFNYSSM